MSFFKKLFGKKSSGVSASWQPDAEEVHEGFAIAAAPMREGDQYRLAGVISKEINGEMKSHKLIRADVFSNKDEAVTFTLRKARQVIDEQGERLFG